MISLSFGIFQGFELVFPSITFKLFVDLYFTKTFMPVPAHISGDPFKAPKAYIDAGGSQRKWEREHGHVRERGGTKLGTLIHDFYCSGSSSVISATIEPKLQNSYFKYWQSNCNRTAWHCNLIASM
jgi:hypothetical protein